MQSNSLLKKALILVKNAVTEVNKQVVELSWQLSQAIEDAGKQVLMTGELKIEIAYPKKLLECSSQVEEQQIRNQLVHEVARSLTRSIQSRHTLVPGNSVFQATANSLVQARAVNLAQDLHQPGRNALITTIAGKLQLRNVVQTPAEGEIQAPVQAPAEGEVQAPVQAPAEGEVRAPVQAPVQAPAEGEVRAPVQAPVQAPAEGEVQAPVQAPAEGEVRAPVQAPAEVQATARQIVHAVRMYLGKQKTFGQVVADEIEKSQDKLFNWGQKNGKEKNEAMSTYILQKLMRSELQ